jgi:glycosyltransferase involved in cell wall biosynthesis
VDGRAVETIKDLIRRYPGKLPAYRWRLALLRAPKLPGLARFEAAEAARALETWGRRPVASVATIIPTYRRPGPLADAVESALAQTVTDQVVVVVDDGGGMPTLPADPRLHRYSLSRNCGVAGVVRNVGIRATASRYLAFLDDDNTWRPDHLEVSLEAHRRGAALTYTALERVYADGTPKDVLSIPFDRRLLREQALSDTNALVVRRTKAVHFSRVPLRRGDFPLEDWELVYRLSRSFRTVHVPRPTARYLVHDDSFFTDWAQAEAHERRSADASTS